MSRSLTVYSTLNDSDVLSPLNYFIFAGFLSKLHGRYGPVVRLWVGPSQLLVSVIDPTLVKEVLTKAEDKLPLTGRTYNLACGKLGLFVSLFQKVCASMQQNPCGLYSITFLLFLVCIDALSLVYRQRACSITFDLFITSYNPFVLHL
jgi:hypothetical protein